jgi:hypothetical protein
MACHRQKTRSRAERTLPALDLLRMPRELLPSVETLCSSSPDMWPYVKRPTVDALKAMMLVHCTGRRKHKAQLQFARQTLQARMQQYAETGSGTVAEAIVYNEFYWRGEQEQSSGLRQWMQCILSPVDSSTVQPSKPSLCEQCIVM